MKLENPHRNKPFRQRRARLARTLREGVVILPTAPERTRNADSHTTTVGTAASTTSPDFASPRPSS